MVAIGQTAWALIGDPKKTGSAAWGLFPLGRGVADLLITIIIIYLLFIYLLTKRYIHIVMYKKSRTTRHREPALTVAL